MTGAQTVAKRPSTTIRPSRAGPRATAPDAGPEGAHRPVLDYAQKFLPDALTFAAELTFLSDVEQRFFSQVQGRTYANVLGLLARWIGAKKLELCADYALGEPALIAALVRSSEEELEHQELFRAVEAATGAWMPPGYAFTHDPSAVARTVLGGSAWAVLALACMVERAADASYREQISPCRELAEDYRDVLRRHARAERRHAALTELEWRREDAHIGADERDAAVGDLIGLVRVIDTILQVQAASDAGYVARACGSRLAEEETRRLEAAMLKAYRLQHVLAGFDEPAFAAALAELVSAEQRGRVDAALAGLR